MNAIHYGTAARAKAVWNQIPEDVRKKMGAKLKGAAITLKVSPYGKYRKYLYKKYAYTVKEIC